MVIEARYMEVESDSSPQTAGAVRPSEEARFKQHPTRHPPLCGKTPGP